MPTGKLAGQVAHASVSAALKALSWDAEKKTTNVSDWFECNQTKIVLKVKSKDELLAFKQKADDLGLTTALITDAGKTVFDAPTVTCLGIGPHKVEDVGDLLKRLRVL